MANPQVADIAVARAVRRRKREQAAQDQKLAAATDRMIEDEQGNLVPEKPGPSIFDV